MFSIHTVFPPQELLSRKTGNESQNGNRVNNKLQKMKENL
jgi:hypothetical protein